MIHAMSTQDFARIRYADIQKDVVAHLIDQGIDPVLAHIFQARGIESSTQLSEDLRDLPPPETLKGMLDASQLLSKHIIKQSAMVVVADYDCDGATSCAVALLGIQALSPEALQLDFVVPNRFIHGYGLTPEIVDLARAAAPKAGLLITVDNGISSIEGVAYAKAQGFDVLITDHHLSSKELPKADAIVNPNQPNCTFPSKNIAGVGVMFYVLMGTRAAMRAQGVYTLEQQPRLDFLLDLVAVGTVADVVKLDKINRILVKKGLQRLRRGIGNLGILALLDVAQRAYVDVKAQDFGFIVGPRINAAGRLDDMSVGIACLMSNTSEQAMHYARILDDMNKERRHIEYDMRQDVHLDENAMGASIVLYQADWHQGVIGILASRVKDRYHRPTLIFAKNSDIDDGCMKASGRSIPGFHMRDAIDLISKTHPHIITKFGGHAMAAGLTIHAHYYQEFCEAFEAIAQTSLTKDQLQKTIYTDMALPQDYHHIPFTELLNEHIWGQGFAPPSFYNDFYIDDIQILKDAHTKLTLRWPENDSCLNAMWFSKVLDVAYKKTKMRVVYELNSNVWRSQARLQLIVQTMQKSAE